MFNPSKDVYIFNEKNYFGLILTLLKQEGRVILYNLPGNINPLKNENEQKLLLRQTNN